MATFTSRPAATPFPERLPDPARFLPAGHRDLIMGDLKLARIGARVTGRLRALRRSGVAGDGLEAGGAKDKMEGLKGGFKLVLNPRAGWTETRHRPEATSVWT
jgi:hypothetical protein